MTALALAKQCTFFHQVGQVASCCCRGRSGDAGVISGTQTALEAIRAFPQHPQQRLLLPWIELPTQSIE